MRRGPSGIADPGPVYGMKVLSAGYPKSGTTSLREACRKLGLVPYMGNSVSLEQWYRGELNFSVKEDFLSGFPWCLEVEGVIEAHPDVKVVLCTREVSGWVRSIRRWMSREIVRGFEIFTEGLKSDEDLARMYVDHNQWVREVCRVPLLEVSWESGDGWPELCEFLGFDIPEGKFPHEMKSR